MSIKVIGLTVLVAKLKRMMAPQLTSEMEKTTKQAVNYVHGKVPNYPAQRPGQAYGRTGTLGREINTKVETMGSNVVGTIGSPTPYAPWVISDEAAGGAGPQAWMHKGRWYTLQGVVKKAQGAVNKFFEDMVARLTK